MVFLFLLSLSRAATLDKSGCVEAKLNHNNRMRKFEFKNYREPKGPSFPEVSLCTKVIKLPRS
jgi:hypothetical protein